MNIDDIPDILTCTAQPIDWLGKVYQSFTLALGFDLRTGAVLMPDAAWGAAMQALEGSSCIDMGLPKKEAEWLLAGKACAPHEDKVTSLVVDMRVGASSRRLLIEQEQAFSALALSWEHTWGTEDENPQGLPPTQVRRAPVTDAASPFGTPACPGPRGAWPCRMQRMGSYDAQWLTTRWPGVPDDFDWAFYNLAQPCQRLPNGIVGNEDVELTNLHPQERRICGHLPGKTLRLFVQREGQWREHAVRADTVWLFPNQLTGLVLWHAMTECGDESATDIEAVRVDISPKDESKAEPTPMYAAPTYAEPPAPAAESPNAEPNAEPIVEPNADATKAHAAASPKAESGASSTSPTDYKALLTSALDENLAEINAGLAELGLPPLTPQQIAETRQRLTSMAHEMQAMEAKMAAQPEPKLADVLRNAGVSEREIKNVQAALDLPKPDPALCRTPAEWHAAIDAYIALCAELLHPSQGTLETMRTFLRLQGPGAEDVLHNMTHDKLLTPQASLTQAGMPPDKAAKFLEILDRDMPNDPAGMKAYAKELELAGGFPEGSVSQKMEDFDQALKKAGFELPTASQQVNIPQVNISQANIAQAKDAQEQSASPAIDDQEAVTLAKPTDRESVIAWLAAGKSLAGCALQGVDLSGLNLSGVDMRAVDLSSGSLAGTQLEGADLSLARLAACDCTDAVFTDAQLRGACLTQAIVKRALFWRADLSEVDATGMLAQDADFSESVLHKAVLDKGSFANALFHKAEGEMCTASGADCTNARLQFCRLPGAVFADADLTGADVHACVLDRANFCQAVLDKASFCFGTSVAYADLTGASLQEGVWTQVRAVGVQLTGCRAVNASFSDGDYTAAVVRGADLRFGDFSRSVLNGADMEGVNLFKGSLREAKLAATNLRNANLYGVDMTRITTDAATIFDGADIHKTIRAAREAAQ